MANIRKYDEKEHVEAIAYLDAKEKELAEVATFVHDNSATDEWNDAKMAKHVAAAQRHTVLTNEVNLIREKIKDFEEIKIQKFKGKKEPGAITRFIEKGLDGLSVDERTDMSVDSSEYFPHAPGVAQGIKFTMPVTAQTRTDDDSGKELRDLTINTNVVEDLAFQGDGVLRMVQRFTTGTGNPYRFIGFDEATEMGTILGAQNTQIATNDLANFTSVQFGARTITSNFVSITREALQDSVIDLESFAERHAGRRIMRRMESEITLDGDGAGTDPISPRVFSVINSASDGVNTATADTLDWTDFVNLEYSCPRAYRATEVGEYSNTTRPGERGYVFGDSMEKNLKILKDGSDRPVWLPALDGLAGGFPATVFGYRYAVSMDGMWKDLNSSSATGDVLAAFGNWGYYARRVVREIEMHRFMDSNTMTHNLIQILMLARFDFRPVGALDGTKTKAVRLLKNT